MTSLLRRLCSIRKPQPRARRGPLRVMFVITSMPVGGAETLLVNLLDRLDNQRAIGEVICLKQAGPLGEQIQDRLRVHTGLLRNKWDVTVLWRLARLLRRRRADAVITVGAGDKMFWGRLAAWGSGVPVIISALHSTGWPDGVGRLNRMLTFLTDGFIAVADSHGEFMQQHLGFPKDRVHVIRNGVDTDRFRPALADQGLREGLKVREELGLDDETPLVGIVAALRPEKNHEMFVDVAAAVLRKHGDAHFLIVGDGPCRETIAQYCKQRGIADRVHLLGTRHDTPRLVAALDVFLLCSHNEASPVSILEALAAHVPVVSTNVGSVSESVIEDETGYLVARSDAAAAADKVCRLLDDDDLNHRLGAAGRQRVLQSGSLQAMVDGYQRLVENLYDQRVLENLGRRSQDAVRGKLARNPGR
ncbi:glycosyltransferase [Roseimaritima sediminicola]|uniref:glycosyltransferase n=1 Tax=Roseimaritima sediminicola TaxID=2662066 RepID=UPI001F2899AE|nr:glycosyltransferase [Roseimaritima sediminicola]